MLNLQGNWVESRGKGWHGGLVVGGERAGRREGLGACGWRKNISLQWAVPLNPLSVLSLPDKLSVKSTKEREEGRTGVGREEQRAWCASISLEAVEGAEFCSRNMGKGVGGIWVINKAGKEDGNHGNSQKLWEGLGGHKPWNESCLES